MKLFYRL